MYNINIMRSDVKAKLENSEQITRQDVTAAMQVAQGSQHMDDKLLYVNVKHAYSAQKENNGE
ncbi:hypothetical protein V7166_17805 [Bacillus thuringiensis]